MKAVKSYETYNIHPYPSIHMYIVYRAGQLYEATRAKKTLPSIQPPLIMMPHYLVLQKFSPQLYQNIFKCPQNVDHLLY